MEYLLIKLMLFVSMMKSDPLTTMAFATTLLELNPLFQAAKIVRLKEAKDVSLWTFVMILSIGTIWFCYGVKMSNWPIIIGNAIKLFSSLTVMIVYFVYKNKRKEDLI